MSPFWTPARDLALADRVPVDVLRQLLRLDVETGRLFWLPRGPEWFNDGAHSAEHTCAIWNAKFAGCEAFATNNQGYRKGRVLGRTYLAHRVIFALMHGYWPVGVDHIDLNRSNNRPDNLREATQQQNAANSDSRGGTSRFRGVSRDRGKWRAYATKAGKRHHLGRFDSEIDAARAFDSFALDHHRAFARLNFPEAVKGIAQQTELLLRLREAVA